jgi:5'-nucleotidase
MTASRPLLTRRVLLGAAASLPMIRLARGEVAHRLSVLHVNDFHSRHEPVDVLSMTCRPDQGRAGCFGGAARLGSAIAEARAAVAAAGRAVLLVDAGDQFQGSLFYTAWKGEVERAVMHLVGTEAMAVGNHEFDNGPATLAAFVRGARFPVLAANIDPGLSEIAGLLRPWIVLDKAGLGVGLVGLTTPATANISSPGPQVRFAPPGPALAEAAAAARAGGARIVLALSHLGVDADCRLAGHVPGVDGIIGGHSHTLLSDSEAGAAGPAHQVLAGPAGRTVVVQAGCYGRYLGRLDLDVAADGTLLAYAGDCRHIGLDLPEQPEVAAIVARYGAQLDGVRRRVVGRLGQALAVADCRQAECPLGDLLADAMLAETPQAEVAMTNGGGMRAGLPAGDVTLGDVLTVLPFGNTLATLQLKGSALAAAVAHGLAHATGGAFAQVAGMRIVWDPAAPRDARLVSLAVRAPDGSFAPLDPDRMYRVVTNNYMRTGGDGYAMLRDAAVNPYDTGPPLDAALTRALAQGAPAHTDGRIAERPRP